MIPYIYYLNFSDRRREDKHSKDVGWPDAQVLSHHTTTIEYLPGFRVPPPPSDTTVQRLFKAFWPRWVAFGSTYVHNMKPKKSKNKP